MPNQVLIYSRFPKALMQRIGERFELMDAAGQRPDEVFGAEQLSGIRAMITAGGTPLGADMMDMMPKLAAIVCYGTGYDGVDLAAAAKRGIAVGHSPGANAASVADIAVTLMLAVTRRLLPADNYVRSGDWAAAKPSPLMRPQPGNPGRRVGVYGMGEIGRKIAARVAAFETEVGYFSRSRHDVPYRYLPSLEALAEWCSVLMIAVRAGADTHHAVDRQDHRRGRSRRLRTGASRPRRAHGVSQRGADPAYRRPYARLASGHAGLRDRQPGSVFRRQAAAPRGAGGLRRPFWCRVCRYSEQPTPPLISPWQALKDSLKNAFRACWPLLARLCTHSENPIQ